MLEAFGGAFEGFVRGAAASFFIALVVGMGHHLGGNDQKWKSRPLIALAALVAGWLVGSMLGYVPDSPGDPETDYHLAAYVSIYERFETGSLCFAILTFAGWMGELLGRGKKHDLDKACKERDETRLQLLEMAQGREQESRKSAFEQRLRGLLGSNFVLVQGFLRDLERLDVQPYYSQHILKLRYVIPSTEKRLHLLWIRDDGTVWNPPGLRKALERCGIPPTVAYDFWATLDQISNGAEATRDVKHPAGPVKLVDAIDNLSRLQWATDKLLRAVKKHNEPSSAHAVPKDAGLFE